MPDIPTPVAALDGFHPAVAEWFRRSFAAPTPAQAEAWPAIQASEHVLIAAPTGSGKTLAAFLAVIAIIPNVVSSELEIDPVVASFYGGTGLLIVVSVALDLVQKINSHLVMRNYPGLTED